MPRGILDYDTTRHGKVLRVYSESPGSTGQKQVSGPKLQGMQNTQAKDHVHEDDDLSVCVPALKVGKDSGGKVLFQHVELRGCLGGAREEDAFELTCPHCETKVVGKT
ncbi:hypothetical protein BU17DRAFT_96783 [Hysterangium stoloniferum]|nr:hypothetical protein BU17DRAFT_96783 [Hysterangium stoloniferum]